MPSAPSRVVTTGRPAAIASITLLRTPDPSRIGAAIAAVASISARRSGTNPTSSTLASRSIRASVSGASRASSSHRPPPATVSLAFG